MRGILISVARDKALNKQEAKRNPREMEDGDKIHCERRGLGLPLAPGGTSSYSSKGWTPSKISLKGECRSFIWKLSPTEVRHRKKGGVTLRFVFKMGGLRGGDRRILCPSKFLQERGKSTKKWNARVAGGGVGSLYLQGK